MAIAPSLRSRDYGNDTIYRNDPNLKYVDRTRRALWESIEAQYAATITPAALTTLHNFYALQLRVVKLMKQNGVKILAGSDLGEDSWSLASACIKSLRSWQRLACRRSRSCR